MGIVPLFWLALIRTEPPLSPIKARIFELALDPLVSDQMGEYPKGNESNPLPPDTTNPDNHSPGFTMLPY